jgi:hypothetical protein
MNNKNTPTGAHAAPLSSSTEEDVKELARRILCDISPSNEYYPIYIIDLTNYVIIDDKEAWGERIPEVYAGYLYVKTCDFDKNPGEDEISEALRDVSGIPTVVAEYIVELEAYNNNTFIGSTKERFRTYRTINYNGYNKRTAEAYGAFLEKVFCTKYPQFSHLPKVLIHPLREDRYIMELLIRIAEPSKVFVQLLQKMLMN